MHLHTHATHMHALTHIHTLMSHTNTCTHIHAHTHSCHTHIHALTHTLVTHTYTHSYTRAHIHTYSTSGQTPSIEAGATLSTVSEKGLGRGPRAVPSWGGRHSFPDCRRKSTEPQRSSFASPRSQHFGESHGGSGGQPWLSIPGDCLSESVDKT